MRPPLVPSVNINTRRSDRTTANHIFKEEWDIFVYDLKLLM